MLFGHLVRMDESSDARRILTAVPQSDWRRPVGRPYTFWVATLKNDLSLHLTFEDAIEMALDKPLWRLLSASGAAHWHGARRIMMVNWWLILFLTLLANNNCAQMQITVQVYYLFRPNADICRLYTGCMGLCDTFSQWRCRCIFELQQLNKSKPTANCRLDWSRVVKSCPGGV